MSLKLKTCLPSFKTTPFVPKKQNANAKDIWHNQHSWTFITYFWANIAHILYVIAVEHLTKYDPQIFAGLFPLPKNLYVTAPRTTELIIVIKQLLWKPLSLKDLHKMGNYRQIKGGQTATKKPCGEQVVFAYSSYALGCEPLSRNISSC